MSNVPVQENLPNGFYLLKEPGFADPGDENRPTRLCICFSDVHFTDGTVGNQGADAVVWEKVFETISELCVDYEAEELTLVLVGDVADMIRTAQWSEKGVYPWQRDHPNFKQVLREIMQEIVRRHATAPSPDSMCSFFHLLQQLPDKIQQCEHNGKTSQLKNIRALVLLGNHDKEIVADDETLKMFYEECLGQKVDNHSDNRLSDDYRRWIGKMYFGDEEKYLDAERNSVPWLPFYWGDPGFRLFVTHGQWRDQDNSRRIDAQSGKPGWQIKDGWRLDVWRDLKFAPFTEACFGDTVAAGVLSGFIYRAKKRLNNLPINTENEQKEISRLLQILDELDLYRPTSAAIKRIIQETWRLRQIDHQLASARAIIEEELLDSIHAWLGWDFTLASAAPTIAWILRIAKPVISVLKLIGGRIELGFLYAVMSLMAWLQQWQQDAPSYADMQKFPGFLDGYRQLGFRIHGEGHTHIPLQEELFFKTPDTPASNRNYTYINFGTWRDQLVPKKKQGYRRRGLGRALVVLDKAGEGEGKPRSFAYWVQDVLNWQEKTDRLDNMEHMDHLSH